MNKEEKILNTILDSLNQSINQSDKIDIDFKSEFRKPNNKEIYEHHIYYLNKLRIDRKIKSSQYRSVKGMINKDETSVINFIDKYINEYKKEFNEFKNKKDNYHTYTATIHFDKPVLTEIIDIIVDKSKTEGNKNE